VPILFLANEFEDYDSYSGTIYKDRPNYYDSNYTRGAVGVANDTTSYLQGNFSTAVSSFWFTCRMGSYYASASCTPISFTDGGTDRLRLRYGTVNSSTNTALSLYRWDGTAETLIGTLSNVYTTSQTNRLDFKVTYSSTGTCEVYRAGALVGTITGDFVGSTGSTTLSGVRLKSAGLTSDVTQYSEVIAATGSTLGMRAKTLIPNAAGDLTAWTGGFANVDEMLPTDTDVINSAVAGEQWSCGLTGLPTGSSGQKVRGIKVHCEAAKGDSGPSSIALGVRTGGTTSYQPDQACSLGYIAHKSSVMETNPVTGQPWTTAELEALQIAFRSA
jgi:hypothetical protein